jgi:hypothetical protein
VQENIAGERELVAAPQGTSETAATAASIFSGRELSTSERIQIAILIGAAAGCVAWLSYPIIPHHEARDFMWPLRGAREILAGINPYSIPPTTAPEQYYWFMFPVTAVVLAMPFAWMKATVAGTVFVMLTSVWLAFALTRTGGLSRCWLFLSPPYLLAVVLGQWSPLLIAVALSSPVWAWLLTAKPIGFALFLWRPTWRGALLCAAFLLVTLAVLPTWPVEWMRNALTVPRHPLPLLAPWGALALVALLRWRSAEARLVLTMAALPQHLYFYDQLPLYLAPRTGRRVALLSACGWVAWGLTKASCATPEYCGPEAIQWVMLLQYVPAALMVALPTRNA